MVDGEDRTTLRPLRPAAPIDGPLAGSGAAPEPATRLPRPRRPWLRSKPDDHPKPADEVKPANAGKPDDEAGTAAGDLAGTKDDPAATTPATGLRRRRVQFAHAVRQPPHRVAIAAARATRDWSRRPSGRLALPGVFLLALVAATAAAGALLVPATARGPRPVAVDATSAAPTTDPQAPLPGGMPLPTQTAPPLGTTPTGPVVGGSTGRPSDALAGWAAQVGPKVGISPVAMQAYGYAEVVLAQTNRSCGLSWTTLAAIGFVESGHGQANGARLRPDGKALPEIIGLPLDGKGGRMRIPDTDRGVMDKDPVLDRAVGPMQFIPTTWQEIGADADNDGVKDPHDLDDAALAAGNYLCKGGRNLTIPADWWNAILSYNDVRRYAQDVYDTANRYGQASHT
ncbi:lytic murein transglycosylase [Micromonospora sp. C31]|uniref:lytic murein transglycosylase n=1 Tax=Micromonospora sp. C31 TaxID=2824876 RepID=UPI001B372F0E|nr:lytic murein transglycosylase [Micromonospora sp. C31]MBQ1072196.1 lytic murein transglycosylase [Micromonospora sp. C31]